MPPPKFSVRLIEAKKITPLVRELTFEKQDGPLLFVPGQWLNLYLPTGEPSGEITRAYSIASAPNGTARFTLAVTLVNDGPGSTVLHQIEPGAELMASGPQGFFTRDADAGHPALMIATGTGLTPLRSMLYAAIDAGATEPLWVLIGVRFEEDQLYRDELLAIGEKHQNVQVHYTLSKPNESWSGKRGYVQDHLEKLWTDLSSQPHQPSPHAYICGLERMVKAVRDKLRKELNVPRERVHSERFD